MVEIFHLKWLDGLSSPQARTGMGSVCKAQHRKETRFCVETINWEKPQGGEASLQFLGYKNYRNVLGVSELEIVPRPPFRLRSRSIYAWLSCWHGGKGYGRDLCNCMICTCWLVVSAANQWHWLVRIAFKEIHHVYNCPRWVVLPVMNMKGN